jgi:hypothetical protein
VPWSGCRQVDFYVLKKSATIVMLWLDILWLLLAKSIQLYEIKCLYGLGTHCAKDVFKQQTKPVKYVVANNILLYRTCSDEINEAFIQSPFKINDEKERKDETRKNSGSSRYGSGTGMWFGTGNPLDTDLDSFH